MTKQKQLVIQHLENISGKVLQEYPDLIKSLIKGQAGVYALYRKQKVYYVGLATNLMGRLKTHLKDRHSGKWDRFSVYLTVHDEHIKELESLILKISMPIGNKACGNFCNSQNLVRRIDQMIKEKDNDNRAQLIGKKLVERIRKKKLSAVKGTKDVSNIFERSIQLKAVFKDETYYAKLRKDGKVNYKKKLYTSFSTPAEIITKRAMNGWEFWRYKNEKGDWVKLKELRK